MRSRLLNLDGLRGVAALAVMLCHAGNALGHPDLVPRGYLAVDFFFLLSGYIMGRTYQAGLEAGQVGRFLWRRFVRLWPLLILGSLVGAGVALATRSAEPLPLNLALGLLCLPHLALNPAQVLFPLNNVQWSLFFECVANGAHAGLRRFVQVVPLAAIMALAGVVMTVGVLGGQHYGDGFTVGSWWMGLARVAFSYSFGLLLYRLHSPTIRAPFFAPTIVMALVLALPRDHMARTVDAVVITAVWPAVLICAANDPDRPGWIARLIRVAGELSYPLYILHRPLVRLAAEYQQALALSPNVLIPLASAAIIAFAWCALVLYDQPVRAFLSSLRWREARATAS